jgi:hypothetical protein
MAYYRDSFTLFYRVYHTPEHLILLVLIIRTMSVTDYEAPYYAVLSASS